MKLRIDKQSEVPVRAQLHEQIIFSISTGELSIGQPLPSVRELARVLHVHHNSVSHVYGELVKEGWLIQRRGSRLVAVQQAGRTSRSAPEIEDLDNLIDRVIRTANDRGLSLQQLARHLRERLLAEPPDHFLIIEPEKELGDLIKEELRHLIGQSPESYSIPRLQQNPAIAIGSILVTPKYLADGVECVPSVNRVVVAITYSSAEPYLETVRKTSRPSVIGVLSISPAFLRTASGLLAPVVAAGRHTFCGFLLERPSSAEPNCEGRIRRYDLGELRHREGVRRWAVEDEFPKHLRIFAPGIGSRLGAGEESVAVSTQDLEGVDLLFCDSITYGTARHPKQIRYRLLTEESLQKVSQARKTLIARAANLTAMA